MRAFILPGENMGLKDYAIAFNVSGKLAGTFNDTFAEAGDKIGKFERQIE